MEVAPQRSQKLKVGGRMDCILLRKHLAVLTNRNGTENEKRRTKRTLSQEFNALILQWSKMRGQVGAVKYILMVLVLHLICQAVLRPSPAFFSSAISRSPKRKGRQE